MPSNVADLYSLEYGFRATDGWWLVIFKDGEPHIAVHPEDMDKPAMKAYRDTFTHWHSGTPDVLTRPVSERKVAFCEVCRTNCSYSYDKTGFRLCSTCEPEVRQ